MSPTDDRDDPGPTADSPGASVTDDATLAADSEMVAALRRQAELLRANRLAEVEARERGQLPQAGEPGAPGPANDGAPARRAATAPEQHRTLRSVDLTDTGATRTHRPGSPATTAPAGTTPVSEPAHDSPGQAGSLIAGIAAPTNLTMWDPSIHAPPTRPARQGIRWPLWVAVGLVILAAAAAAGLVLVLASGVPT